LLLLDAVLHIATGAVKPLVEVAGWPGIGIEIGDDETRIGTFPKVLRLGDDAPYARPCLLCGITQLLEDTCGET